MEGFLIKLNKEEGVLGKTPYPLPYLPALGNRGGGGARRSSRARGLGARRRPGVEGKRAGVVGDRSLPSIWEMVARRGRFYGGGWWLTLAGAAAAPQSTTAARTREKKEEGSSGTPMPTSARAAVLRGGDSAVACVRGGDNGGWWC